jgi:hypothetical protein
MPNAEAYLVVLTGFILSIIIILSAQTKISSWFVWLIKALLVLEISFYCARLLCLPFPKNLFLATILHSGYIAANSLYAGAFVGYGIIYLFLNPRLKIFNAVLFQNTTALYPLLRFSVAGIFLYSSITSICFYSKYVQFFTSSGYSPAFYIFIIIVEFTGAAGILFRRTVLYAAVLLECDMLGAVYTHYHNYFSKHLPDPLGNSIPSLITQTTLLSIIAFTLYLRKDNY